MAKKNNAQGKEQIITTNPVILGALREKFLLNEHKEFNPGVDRVEQMDAVDLLAGIPDKSVDMVLTDELFGAAKTLIEVAGRNSPLMDTDFGWDGDVPSCMTMPWVLEAARVLKPGGCLLNCGFSEWTTLFKDVCLNAGLYWKATIHVVITNPRPQARKKNFRSGHFDMWWVSKGVPKTFNFGEQQEMRNWVATNICPNCSAEVPVVLSNRYDVPQWIFNLNSIPGIWAEAGPLTHAIGKRHPCQKQDWLALKYIQIFSNPGDIIVDPFGGSGWAAVNAARLGRHYITGDTDPEWVEVMRQKLKYVQVQQ